MPRRVAENAERTLRVRHNLSRGEATAVALGMAQQGDPRAVYDALAKSFADEEAGSSYPGEAARVAEVTAGFNDLVTLMLAQATGLVSSPLGSIQPLSPQTLWQLCDALRALGREALLRDTEKLAQWGDFLFEPEPTPLAGVRHALNDGFGVNVTRTQRMFEAPQLAIERAQIEAGQLLDRRLADLPHALQGYWQGDLHAVQAGEQRDWRALVRIARTALGNEADFEKAAQSAVRFAYATGVLAGVTTPYVRFLVQKRACRLCHQMLEGVRTTPSDLWQTYIQTRGYQPSQRSLWQIMVPLHPFCTCTLYPAEE